MDNPVHDCKDYGVSFPKKRRREGKEKDGGMENLVYEINEDEPSLKKSRLPEAEEVAEETEKEEEELLAEAAELTAEEAVEGEEEEEAELEEDEFAYLNRSPFGGNGYLLNPEEKEEKSKKLRNLYEGAGAGGEEEEEEEDLDSLLKNLYEEGEERYEGLEEIVKELYEGMVYNRNKIPYIKAEKFRRRELGQYHIDFEKTDGFDVGTYPHLKYFSGINREYYRAPDDNINVKELNRITDLASIYNDQHGNNYTNVKVLKIMTSGCGGMYYYITFQAALPDDDKNPHTFEAKVYVSLPLPEYEVEVLFVRLKKSN